jgi:DNA-binding transcriptional LysR family regulator
MDLALTRVLCAIHEAGSVSRAADTLCLSQPAVSHALRRMRQILNDPLFVRDSGRMLPTPRTQELYPVFREAIRMVEQAVDQAGAFDAATTRRRYTIALPDTGEMVFLPHILRVLEKEAPEIGLTTCQLALPELRKAMANGNVDLAIGNLPQLTGYTPSMALFDEHIVCLVRKGHPTIGRTITLAAFLAARHAAVISIFSSHLMVEQILAGEGARWHVALETPNLTSIPGIIAGTDLLVTVPSRVARVFCSLYDVRSIKLPFAMPSFTVRIYWHERSQADAGLTWMRTMVARVLSAL